MTQERKSEGGGGGGKGKGGRNDHPPKKGHGLFLKQKLIVEPGGWAESDEGDYGSITEAVLFCSGSMFPREKEILLDVF